MSMRNLAWLVGGSLVAAATLVGRAQSPVAESDPPTFSEHVAPIIFNNCTTCHRPGEATPFSLMSYEDVRLRGRLIASVTRTRRMPPWKAGPSDYPFKGDRRLTDDQIDTLQRWVEAGMREGDRGGLPALPTFTEGWQLGPPDLVVSMSEPFTVPAAGSDIYRNFVVPLNLTEDQWLTAIDFRPSARGAVHHSLFLVDSTGAARQQDARDPRPGYGGTMGLRASSLTGGRGGPAALFAALTDLGGSGGLRMSQGSQGSQGAQGSQGSQGSQGALGSQGAQGPSALPDAPDGQGADVVRIGALGGWVPGARVRPFPDDLAVFVPKGSDLILSTHFHPSGKVEEEMSTVGLYFADAPPSRAFAGLMLPSLFGVFEDIEIPAGEPRYTIEDSFVLPVDVQAFNVGAHAHYLGKEMKLTATFPDGTVRTLLSIEDWDFSWQEQYQFEDFVLLPKDTRLDVTVTYDNSAANPRNPNDPPRIVRWGEQSTDEMGGIGLQVVAVTEGDLPRLQQAYTAHVMQALLRSRVVGRLLQQRLR